jgi:hypothetical protein
MNHPNISPFARRASLSRAGATGVATQATPVTADSKKKKRKKGDVDKRCKQQAADWIEFVPTFCGDGALCQEIIACARPLRTCDFTGFLVCLAVAPEDLFDPAFPR